MEIYRLREGKIDEQWVNVDTLGMMQQIGAISVP
jgi:predicted ester cyclase